MLKARLNDIGVIALAALHSLPVALTIVATMLGCIFYGVEIWESETRKELWRKWFKRCK